MRLIRYPTNNLQYFFKPPIKLLRAPPQLTFWLFQIYYRMPLNLTQLQIFLLTCFVQTCADRIAEVFGFLIFFASTGRRGRPLVGLENLSQIHTGKRDQHRHHLPPNLSQTL